MSDLRIRQFREQAERGVSIPDLAVIEKRGRALRRRRVATAAGALALTVVTVAGVTGTWPDGRAAAPGPAAPASPSPSLLTAPPRWDDGVRTAPSLGEEVLRPGVSEVHLRDISVRFDVPGRNWEWWNLGMGLRRTAGARDDYGGAIFLLVDPRARLAPCRAWQAQALGSDPEDLLADVAPLLDVPHATVVRPPRIVNAFGGPAVHVLLQTRGACQPDAVPAMFGTGLSADDIAWPGTHLLDVWHVVVPGTSAGSILVLGWDLDGTADHRAEQRALLDSLRISALPGDD